MYSTMMMQHNLINHTSQLFTKQLVLDSLYDNKVEKFFIARNPYDRIVSCYFNKLVENDISSSLILQHCQKILLPFFKIDSSELPEIEEELKKISFSQFISQLRFFYDLDDHYLPQYSLKLIPYFSVNHEENEAALFSKFNIRILKMERDIVFLSNRLGLNMSIKVGRSDHKTYNNYYTSDLYEDINSIYEKDFKYFGYKMHN
ncbi:MAG TPA: sulfotransferase family 2 domain-containing protein [Puia sp.]|nr:sulfotransferase family 2 domain-containing protein [Puia sp.]